MGYPAWGGPAYPYPVAPVAPAATMTAEQEVAGLKQQAEYLGNALAAIKERIEELEAESGK
jgi:hypothetical protein